MIIHAYDFVHTDDRQISMQYMHYVGGCMGSIVFVKSILLLSLISQEIIDYIIGIFAIAETLSL